MSGYGFQVQVTRIATSGPVPEEYWVAEPAWSGPLPTGGKARR